MSGLPAFKGKDRKRGGEDKAVDDPCSPRGLGTCLPLNRRQTCELEGTPWCCALTPKGRVEFRLKWLPLKPGVYLPFQKSGIVQRYLVAFEISRRLIMYLTKY